jgi:hypothetical protein
VTTSSHRGSKNAGQIYIGVGGWTFAPWRGVFYPDKLTQAKELEYAASKLTSIEINGTYSQFPMSALALNRHPAPASACPKSADFVAKVG